MYQLHFQWIPETRDEAAHLHLWAETAVGLQPKFDKRLKEVQAHPFTYSESKLIDLVAKMINNKRVAEATVASQKIWLPSNKFGPLPSPALNHNWKIDETPPTLRQWYVSGCHLPLSVAFFFLLNFTEAELPAGMKLGKDGQFWQVAFNFLLEMMMGQKFRPLLVPFSNVYEARWTPVLDEEGDAQRLLQLIDGMPPLCRAHSQEKERAFTARFLLMNFLNIMGDTAVRYLRPQARYNFNDEIGQVWMNGLVNRTEATVHAPLAQLQHLYTAYQSWERLLYASGDQNCRITFRLEAPVQAIDHEEGVDREETKEDKWQLHYLLQARGDTTLLLPATQIWGKQKEKSTHLDQIFKEPQTRLLAGLGYASRFSTAIEKSLRQKEPTGVELSNAEAFEFLRHSAPHLEKSGFGLLVPPWWNKPGTRLGTRLKLGKSTASNTPLSSRHLSLQNLVSYEWQIALGGETLTPEELQSLVALKTPLIFLRGQWVQLDPEQIEKAIQFWEQKNRVGTTTIYDALHMQAQVDKFEDGLPIADIELDDWFTNWLDTIQGDGKLELLATPKKLEATLRPYQLYGYSWLMFARQWGLGVILADDMGLGKTIQALTMLLQLKEEMGTLPNPVLLICPTSVVINWQLEAEKFTPDLKIVVHQGSGRDRDEAFFETVSKADMILTSYAIARRDGETFKQVNWLGIILDEAQNIKNAQTKQAQLIRQLSTEFRLALTGTPVENRLSELWSIMQFLNPNFLGPQKKFRQEFEIPIAQHHNQETADHLRQLIRPFILRRVKTDPTVIQDLPDKQEMKVFCTLSTEQVTLYEAIVQEALRGIEEGEGIQRRGLVLSMLMQLKQVCNHPVQYLHQADEYSPLEDMQRSGKMERLQLLLEEIFAENGSVLIFTQFKQMGQILESYIQAQFGVQTLFLHGGVRAKKRAEMVVKFQAEQHAVPVFILSLKAGGTGLNLTKANHVIHFDRWWNPAVEDQATDRAFRIGQKRNVLVHKFVCIGTLEEKIDKMISDKKALAENVIGSGEGWLTEVSTADLRELVRLRH